MSDEKKGGTFEEQEVLVVKNFPSKNKEGAGLRVRLVRWRVDGSVKSVKLEKRAYFIGEDGTERTGKKAEGLVLEDFAAIKAMWPQILAAFRNPPEFIPTRAAGSSSYKGGAEIEQVPFDP